MNTLTFEPIFGSTLLVLAVLVAAGLLLWLLRPAGRQLSTRQLRWLMGLRLAALLLLLLALLRPAWVRSDARPAVAQLAVLMDASRSMTLPAGANGSRWDSERKIIRQLVPALGTIDEQLAVRYYRFGGKTTAVDETQIEAFLEGEPESRQTDLAQALRSVISEASGQPLAGVILIGDGTSTVDDSNPGTVARTLQSLDVPLWTIPIGPRNDASNTRDLAVEQLAESFRVFTKNSFVVTAAIRARGLLGRNIGITVDLIDDDGNREEIATRTLTPSTAEDTLPLEVELTAPAPGNYRLELRAEPQPGETLTENNRQLAFLDVREGGGRILYIEGQPRFEQKYLRRAIGDSPDLTLRYQWIDASTQDRWPIDFGNAISSNRFDVFILGDLDARALGPRGTQAIATAVREGSGLLLLGGLHTYDSGGYAATPLADVLPIQLDASRRVPFNAEPSPASMLTDPITLRVQRPHPIVQLTRSGNNAQLWRSLAPLRGANRFAGVKINPNVATLLESETGDPMLVIGAAGKGRVATFAGDTTWQWWLQGRSDIHRRFWRQLLLWLLARDNRPADSIWVEIDARRFDRESPPAFRTGIETLDANAGATTLTAELIAADGTRTSVPLRQPDASGTDSKGLARSGQIPELAGGLYRLRVTGTTGDKPLEPAEMLFQVLDIDAELSRPMAEVARLEQLAAITESAGGKAYRPDEMDALIAAATELRRRGELPIVEKKRLGDDPLSGWLLMCLMTGLLSAEWYCRRIWGLA